MAVSLHRTTSAFSFLKLNHSWNDTLVSHPCRLYQSSALNLHPAQQKQFRSQVAQTPCNPAGGTFTLFLEKTQLHQWFFPQWPGKHIHGTSVLCKATWRIVYTILSYNPWGALSAGTDRVGKEARVHKTESALVQLLVGRMLWTGAIHLKPLIDTPERGRGWQGAFSLVTGGSWAIKQHG